MKIKPEHYRYLQGKILHVNLPGLHEKILKDGKYKDFGKRFRWDALYAAVDSSWVCDNLYPYMNDEHIDTALKHILRG